MPVLLASYRGRRRPPAAMPIAAPIPIPKEVLMRILALVILAIGTISIGPAAAQTYDPAYPVCLHLYGRAGNYYECRYTSLPQCNASASGRAAHRSIKPSFAGRPVPANLR